MNNFKIQTLDKWRREFEKEGTVNTQPRPHIVPLTQDGKGYLEYMKFAPAVEGPVGPFSTAFGFAEVNGEWIRVYRFIEVMNEESTLQRFENSLAKWVDAGRPEKGPIGDTSEEGRELKRLCKD